MVEILKHLQAHKAEVGGIAQYYRQVEAAAIFLLYSDRHIDEARKVAADAHTRHEGQLFHLVLEQLHLVV